ncbi:MAG: FprA family A-type flavoprotein, partial [Desulfobacterales bacterium]|nr:FprA family A-type flavoprotein [Desulfobacterales bacterium]
GAAFGSYGWSGEAVKQINNELTAMNIEPVDPGLRIQYVPEQNGLDTCHAYGKKIGQMINDSTGC